MRNNICGALVTIINSFQSRSHQYNNGMMHIPQLDDAFRKVTTPARRSADDTSIDITNALCTTNHDDRHVTVQPLTNKIKL